MSYILEALKKLEQRRQHEEGLTLLTFQGGPARKGGRRRIWIYAISAALAINAGAVVWWLSPWKGAPKATALSMQSPAPAAPAAPAAVTQVPETAPSPPPPPVAKPAGAAREAVSPPAPSATAAKPAAVRPPGEAKAAPPRPKTAPPPEEAYPDPPARSELKPPADKRVYRLTELPGSVSAGLPLLKMSLHYYAADPQARFARINDKNLKEGQTVAENVKLEEINAAGVVINYKGWRFTLPINETP